MFLAVYSVLSAIGTFCKFGFSNPTARHPEGADPEGADLEGADLESRVEGQMEGQMEMEISLVDWGELRT